MTKETRLVRRVDRKVFRVTNLAHWSDIQAEDGEKDIVKWYGDGYVSESKGFSYEEVR